MRLGGCERERHPESGQRRTVLSPGHVRSREAERRDPVDLTEDEERVGATGRQRHERGRCPWRPSRRGRPWTGPDCDPHGECQKDQLHHGPHPKRSSRVKQGERERQERTRRRRDEREVDHGAGGKQGQMPRVLDLLVVELSSLAIAQQQRRHVRGREVGAALAEWGHLGPGDRVIREKDGADGGRDGDRATGSHGVWTLASRSGERTRRCRIASYTRPTMASAFTGIDHVGIAVADLDVAVAAYERLTGSAPAHRQVIASDGIEAVMFQVGELAYRTAREHRPGLQDRGLSGTARQRAPSRRLFGRGRPGEPRWLRRARAPAARHLSATRRGWAARGIPPPVRGRRRPHRALPT